MVFLPDKPSANYIIALIQHHGLPGSNRCHRILKNHMQLITGLGYGSHHAFIPISYPAKDMIHCGKIVVLHQIDSVGIQFIGQQFFPFGQHHEIFFGIYAGHIQGMSNGDA